MSKVMIEMNELIEEISMGPFGSDIKVDNFVETGVPVLNGSNVNSVRLTEESFNYVTPEKAKSLKKANAKRGDIVITHRGTLGQIAFIPENSLYDNYIISQSQFKVRLKANKVDPAYFTYYFHTNEGQKRLLSFKNHVGVPALAQATTNFRKLEFPLIPLFEQQKIAKVLSDLDAKIEINNKINTELEAMAKTLYDYWFVQFDFPDKNGKPYKSSGGKMVWNEELKREIPEGWVVEELGNELNVQRGISYKSSEIKTEDGIPMINLNSFNLDGTYKHEGIKIYSGKYADKNIVKSGDLLIAVTDVTRNADIIGKSIIVPDYYKEAVISMDIAKIIPIGNLTESYLMMLFNSKHYHNYIKWFASGTIVLHLNLDGMNWYKAEIPPKKLLKKFDDFYKPLAKRINETKKQNQELASLRDWLLPMLMNGQVTVGDVEEELGMVAEGSVEYKRT